MIQTLNLQPRWFIRPKNTDWTHSLTVKQAINARSGASGLQMKMASIRSSALENVRYLKRAARIRNGGPAFCEGDYSVVLTRQETARVRAIYANGRFIEPTDGTPIVWHDGPSDEEVLRRGGWSDAEIAALLRIKRQAIEGCSQCLVSTDYGVRVFKEAFPAQAHKVSLAPFLLPHVRLASADDVTRKHERTPVRLLFVGRQAHRKGLDILLPAFAQLQHRFGDQVTLDVVSSFDDGWKPDVLGDGVTLHSEVPPNEVMDLMARAHLFVMPSRVESYGIVYVEALSQGAIPVAVDREPQRSLFQDGRIGVLTQFDGDALAHDLTAIIGDEARRLTMARAGHRAFESRFGYEAVRRIYETALVKAANSVSS